MLALALFCCGAVYAADVSVIDLPDFQEARATFEQPPVEFSTAPLWVWNDMITPEQIRFSLRDLDKHGIHQVFVHPRPGLMTPYLSEDWFELWRVTLAEAKRLGMNVWIYDENSYPSGFAGGLVPERLPETRGMGLSFIETNSAPSGDFLGVYRIYNNDICRLVEPDKSGNTPVTGTDDGKQRYLAVKKEYAGKSPWHGGRYYVDLLNPKTTPEFLEVTLGAYKRELGDEFGKLIPGSFTDEPRLRGAGNYHWTGDLEERFRERWGYSLIENLPALHTRVGDWKRVRHNYYQLLSELFIQRWAKPYYEYCETNGLEFTGHYWEHEWPRAALVPDNMAMYAWQHRPGIDTLMNQYNEGTHAQFGNVRAVMEVASVANQLGLPRTLCEAYGAAGWDLRFEDMKRIGDWLYVLGINTMNQHLSYLTIRGARKRDHPLSFSYHEPWWDAYTIMSGYFERLSAALSQGRSAGGVLLLEPTTTAWMYNSAGGEAGSLGAIGDAFQKTVVELAQAQIEFDLASESILADHGSVKDGTLNVGVKDYDILVVPWHVENLNKPTAELIRKFLARGGKVLSSSAPPGRIDGGLSGYCSEFGESDGWILLDKADLVDELKCRIQDKRLEIARAEDDKGMLFHNRRILADAELLFMVNTSLDHHSSGTIRAGYDGVEEWDPSTGEVLQCDFESDENGVALDFDLPPAGSVLLFFGEETMARTCCGKTQTNIIHACGDIQVSAEAPNVLVLDYVDVSADGESRTNQYFYRAQDWVFKQNGLGRNPWDSSVQFGSEIIDTEFSADSGFEAMYEFVVEGEPPAGLSIVVERPDLYEICVNGSPLESDTSDWWLDRAFGRIGLGDKVVSGTNRVTLHARKMTVFHELEPAYLIGDFSLKSRDSGFAVVSESGLRMGHWNEQGYPFYGAGVAYKGEFELKPETGRYILKTGEWYGSVAEVRVNSRNTGYLISDDRGCDVTAELEQGSNIIEIIVYGTLRNTLGPHHNGDALGSAWPGMFRNGPYIGPPAGSEYSTVGYGMQGPFFLEHVVEVGE